MSTKGIYTAVSGAIAQNTKLESHANNIANTNTAGFKKDQQVFQEYVTAYEKQPDVIQVPKVPASIESFYDMQGGDKSYVDTAGTYTDFSQGALKKTANRLDVAIEGEGFFEVLTPAGPRVTRNGSFKMDQDGFLVTKNGHRVLRRGEQPPEQRGIQFAQTADVRITPQGMVFEGSVDKGQLSLLTVNDNDTLHKVGQSLFTIKNNSGAEFQPTEDFKLHQGFLETSNINIVDEMTKMIGTTRLFESTQKAIKAYDKMNELLSNEVPRVEL